MAAGIMRDKTWKHDLVPHFEAHLKDGSELVMWVDHPDAEERALPNGARYGLERYAKGKLPETLFETNSLEEALLALRGILEEYGSLRLL